MSDLELEDAPAAVRESEPTTTRGSAEYPRTQGPCLHAEGPIAGVRIGTLVGMTDEGRTPLVIFPGQPGSAALGARAVLDLHGDHVGRDVVLMFEDGDSAHPIILGCLPGAEGWPITERPGQVEVDADGERLTV